MSRDRILGRLLAAQRRRAPTTHPGSFGAWRPGVPPPALEGFRMMFETAGGEVVHVPGVAEATGWLGSFSTAFESMVVGSTLPPELTPARPEAPADRAALGLSRARCAVAETGSLVLDARDGRRAQLLPPTHVVVVLERDIHRTLGDALTSFRSDLPSAIGLHSGPSRSADIGQVMVRGVHGPGRIVALVVGGAMS